ncbi:probable peroxygenase 5 [Rutidosis leptorrhynchoides]|uniref:probable peroxygenase 5 n=1 Tax=Rutidosis leptorrhynchoides TaxID=125765 RepID=UPI003A99B640
MAARSEIIVNKSSANYQNLLQKHVIFFDRNHDGVIYPSETYQGLRAIGSGIFKSAFFAVIINVGLSGKTRPGKIFPNLLFPIYIQNIVLAKHTSDSDIYDSEGRFVPAKFEELFQKHARTNPNALTEKEVDEFIKANREPKDYLGWIAAIAEWKLLYDVGKDENGLIHKDIVRGVFDGSLFEQLAEKHANSSKKKQCVSL